MKNERTKFLVAGCETPNEQILQAFWAEARSRVQAETKLPVDFQVRWIGGNEETTKAILAHIRTGNKTGTVHVPQAVAHSGQPVPAVGDAIVLIEMDGTPKVLVQISEIETVPYSEISERHTALDGPAIRELELWKQIHRPYFDMLLAPAGISCTAETPIAFERFRLIYAKD